MEWYPFYERLRRESIPYKQWKVWKGFHCNVLVRDAYCPPNRFSRIIDAVFLVASKLDAFVSCRISIESPVGAYWIFDPGCRNLIDHVGEPIKGQGTLADLADDLHTISLLLVGLVVEEEAEIRDKVLKRFNRIEVLEAPNANGEYVFGEGQTTGYDRVFRVEKGGNHVEEIQV